MKRLRDSIGRGNLNWFAPGVTKAEGSSAIWASAMPQLTRRNGWWVAGWWLIWLSVAGTPWGDVLAASAGPTEAGTAVVELGGMGGLAGSGCLQFMSGLGCLMGQVSDGWVAGVDPSGWMGLGAARVGLLGQAAETVSEDAGGGWLSVLFAGGPIGVVIVVLLMALSLVSFYLVFDQILTLRHSELIPVGLGDEVRQSLLEGRTEEASEACRQKPSLLAFVLLNGIAELPYGWSSVEKALEDALAEQSARLHRKAEYLSVIGNIAPMVGLLGTVLGMILAFQRVAESQGTASASELAEGIYQALITTVGGLIVAIPSLGAFAILRNRLDQLVAEAANVAQHVFAPLRKKKSAAEKRSG